MSNWGVYLLRDCEAFHFYTLEVDENLIKSDYVGTF